MISPNARSARWRLALGAAESALRAEVECPGPMLLPGEAHERRTHLVRERDEVQRLLEADAAVERLPLTRRLTFPSVSRAQLGLPTGIDACVFELDGVLTPSADLHFAAWSAVLDDFRRSDYEEHFEGRPRLDGLRLFLASRGLTVPERTIRERTDAKNRALQALLRREGVTAFAGATRYLEALAGSGLASVVVSASANTIAILGRAGIRDLVDVVVDGNRMADLDLRPKPAADVVVAACEELGLRPLDVACFEIAAAGVEAARAAGAGLVVFVARHEAKALPADRVIGDLAELLV
jgi:HAD superfamily hydrolase (TIGR01509 family)